MKKNPLYLGKSPMTISNRPVEGAYLDIDGEIYYKIANYDQMPPFLMSLVSDSDHWLFISSNGGLTAGRRNPDNALFPYYTDDKIHDASENTGSRTVVIVSVAGRKHLWEPFSQRYDGVYDIERNLYKNIYGNKLTFEEINHDLAVTFSYAWMNSEKFGFVKRSHIVNQNRKPVAIDILDGMQNLLPAGIDRRFQQEYSTLVDGYKKNELLKETALGLFLLSSIPVDKAEPSESLRATTVWSAGLKKTTILLSSRQVQNFRLGQAVRQEADVRGERGAYFIRSEFRLEKGAEKEWSFAVDGNKDAAAVVALAALLKTEKNIARLLVNDVACGTDNLLRIIAVADGLQSTEDQLSCSRHCSDVLFNVMRGGIFNNGYIIEIEDFLSFVGAANKTVAKKHEGFFRNLPEKIHRSELLSRITALNDANLEKLGYEYLPLTFSRRHGDPSRPWNQFSIETKDLHGRKKLDYQGNWRDIFQNWEALALSYPEYVEGMIAKFVNASTIDGYNPYRVTRDGFDWESLDPHDPWSYIGYWGDHQVIYLVKLLEISSRYHPGRIHDLLSKEIFAYAHVPYRIKPYSDMVKDPHRTIDFDAKLDREIHKRVEQMGTDGKFIPDRTGNVIHVNLTEKMLVSVLAKLVNFIPEAGIWMNTQRPDWNDANNALVGYGVSMVTLYYLRRYIVVLCGVLRSSEMQTIQISEEVTHLFASVDKVFKAHVALLHGSISNRDRKTILDQLGYAGTEYRNIVYANGLSEQKKNVDAAGVREFLELTLKYLDHTIKANKREDNLYHAYNLMKVENGEEIHIRHLYEMLEGQVAVLSAGYLTSGESLAVLDALRKSVMYRKDQQSYMLYPNRDLPRFDGKNNIPAKEFAKSELLKSLIKNGNTQIVVADVNGGLHFSSNFRNKNFLKSALEDLKDEEYQSLLHKEKDLVLEIYERMFDHQSFTGRSGTFYKYEGLGSIYWHMVSKLLLAVQEAVIHAQRTNAAGDVVRRLMHHYWKIREGIGVHKSPSEYGAFPTDPYSHTPGQSGVQQPGMTGQVKEDIISRFGELGVEIENGKLAFRPLLLQKNEFLQHPKIFQYIDLIQTKQHITLEKGTLAFTYCQVPVVYHLSHHEKIGIMLNDGGTIEFHDSILNDEMSSHIFTRSGAIRRVDVFLHR